MKVELTEDEAKNNSLVTKFLIPLFIIIIFNLGLFILIYKPLGIWKITFTILAYLIIGRALMVFVSFTLMHSIMLIVKTLEFLKISPLKVSSARLDDFQLIILYFLFCEFVLFLALINYYFVYI